MVFFLLGLAGATAHIKSACSQLLGLKVLPDTSRTFCGYLLPW
jgi:hypothetical protein